MGDLEVPTWLKSLPLAPEYRPTETEFADPIAFISRIEQEASAFGICKVIPPLPKPSKKFVFANLSRSLSKSPELGPDAKSPGGGLDCSSSQNAVLTTRHQELGSRRSRGVHKQVWQSGEVYTLEQFEAKSKTFARNQLGNAKDVSPLVVESMFWKAASEKPIYIEYANDVPGSAFGMPEEPFRCYSNRCRRKRKLGHGQTSVRGAVNITPETPAVIERPKKVPCPGNDKEGTAGWKLSNSPWNLQVIARSPGSLTRFMPDEVPGVTSPMVYIGMLFSWFAWHVEDHELHSLNFLHTGSQKTWYAVPGDYASTVEDVVRRQGYGGDIDRLAAFIMLGEKRTLFSPEVLVASGIPCCRLVQNPGEFVVTFPRAYHVGFSHGFNCGEAANFATSKWLTVAKEAAVRRAAMNYLPMLSHQQLLYMLAVSFISRVPRAFLPGARSSRLRDRIKEEREDFVKRAFLEDITNEHSLLHLLLGKEGTLYAVFWDPDLLPSGEHSTPPSPLSSSEKTGLLVNDCRKEATHSDGDDETLLRCNTNDHSLEDLHTAAAGVGKEPCQNISTNEMQMNECDGDNKVNCASFHMEDRMVSLYVDDDLPCGLDVDSGTLACVACGILGYPFMCIVQPSGRALKGLFSSDSEVLDGKVENSKSRKPVVSLPPSDIRIPINSATAGTKVEVQVLQNENESEETAEGDTPNSDMNHQIRSASCCNVDQSMPLVLDDFGVCDSQPATVLDEGNEQLKRPAEANKSGSFVETTQSTYMDTLIDDSNGGHCIYGSKKLEENVEDADNLDGTSSLDRERRTKTDGTLGAPIIIGGSDLDSKWNTTNPLSRPRIFCLQHALEVQELLQCKGGSNVLIICHSDYLKIKAQALSVAEEIGAQFNFKDLPIGNASKADLDLINISIDDEECEEHGEDWTSKLFLNLRYCVKLRKQSSSKQERLSFVLAGLFSDPVPLSVASNLKWHSRKSRTNHRGAISCKTRLQDGDNKKNRQIIGNICGDPRENVQIDKSCEGEPSGIAPVIKHHGHPGNESPKKLHGRSEATMDDNEEGSDNQRSLSGSMACTNEELRDEVAELSPVPKSTSKKTEAPQDGIVASEIKRASESSCPALSEDFQTSTGLDKSYGHLEVQSREEIVISVKHIAASELESLEVHGKVFPTDTGFKNKVCNLEESEHQPASVSSTVQGSETLYDMRPMDRTDIEGKAESIACEEAMDDSGMLQGFQMETKIEETGVCGTIEEQLAALPTSIVAYSEMQEISAAEDVPREGGAGDSSKPEAGQVARVSSSFQIPKIIQISETNKIEEKDQSLLFSPSIKCYVRKKRIREETSLTTNSSFSMKPAPTSGNPVIESCEIHQVIHTITGESPTEGNICSRQSMERGNGNSDATHFKPSEIHSNKKRRVIEQCAIAQYSCDGFIRSPCEGLRARTCRTLTEVQSKSESKNPAEIVVKRSSAVVAQREKSKGSGAYGCDIEGCQMRFRTKEELALHKHNRCTYEGCGKRFRNHRYAMRHQRVHADERPLKCPWKGCTMSFKWAWARTEHLRVHTGERPYKCKVTGCGLTFRFVSDFSRHRRKTGHSGNSSS